MSNSKKPFNKGLAESSLLGRILVPVAIALIAGSTAPWWISSIKGNRSQSAAITKPQSDFGKDGITSESKSKANSAEIESINEPEAPANNSPIDLQGQGNQAVVQGSGNNIIQGSGNQLTFQQASEANSRGEFDLPAISGMTYHEAREKLIDSGWIPATQRHLYGASEPGLQFGNGKAFWDTGYWEVVSCSGTAEAFCRFHFDDPSGRRLVVVTAGLEDQSRGIEAKISRVSFEEESP